MSHQLSPGEVVEDEEAPVNEEYYHNLSVRLICPDCREDPPNIYDDHSSGDTLCDSCGLVLTQRGIDQRAEWRTFANDDQGNDDPSRVGDAANPLLNGNQLETSIAFGDGSMRSKELHRAQNKANSDKNNKGLLQAYKQIGSYCEANSLPATVADGAKHIYKDADESKNFRGKSTEALIAGCIFISCRRNNFGRTFREIYDMTQVSKKEIGRTFKMLEKFLQGQEKKNGNKPIMTAGGVLAMNNTNVTTESTKPSDLCRRYCSALHLSHRITEISCDLADRMSAGGALAGRSPISGAAACIYMASHLMNDGRSPKAISDVARVSDSTIRNAYKNLWTEKENLIAKEWLEKGGDMERLPKPS